MSRLLMKLKLRSQVAAVGLVGLAVLLLVGLIQHLSANYQAVRQFNADDAVTTNELISAVNIDLLQGRRHEKDFFLRNSDDVVTKHQAAMTAAQRDVVALNSHLRQEQDRVALRHIQSGLEDYVHQFSVVVARKRELGLSQDQGLMGTMRQAIHAIESTLQSIDHPRLQVLMLMMRRHEKDFLARLDPKYGEDLKKRAAEFQLALANSGLADATRTDILTKLEQYQKSFLAVMAATLDIQEESKRLSADFAAIEPILADLSAKINGDYQTSRDDIQASRTQTSQLLLLVMLGGAVLVAFGIYLVGGAICRPLIGLTGLMQRLARGELRVQIPEHQLELKTEIGDMARAIQVFDQQAQQNQEMTAAEAREAEAKQCRQYETDELIDMFGSSIAGVLVGLSDASTTMANTAQALSAAANETNHEVDVVSGAVGETASNAQSVAAASQELTAAIGEISRLIHSSSTVAEQGSAQAREVAEKVARLSDTSTRIGDIIKIIADIASQTNLLALNATIEAARAGEHGKGFAVVAGEVKNLSAQTQKATVDIASQINEIQNSIVGTVDSVQAIGRTVTCINEASSEIAAAVTEQQSATDEIARNVQFVSASAESIATSIDRVRDSAGRTNQASGQVHHSSSAMAGQADRLSQEVHDFLAAIKNVGSGHRFERLEVERPAQIVVAGETVSTRARQISIAGVWLDTQINLPSGTVASVTIDGVGRPIQARIAGQSDKGTRLQFPMDSAHLSFMGQALNDLNRLRAA